MIPASLSIPLVREIQFLFLVQPRGHLQHHASHFEIIYPARVREEAGATSVADLIGLNYRWEEGDGAIDWRGVVVGKLVGGGGGGGGSFCGFGFEFFGGRGGVMSGG
jgi:hypothetical protein